ncbi:5-guanidino-2-oxopentanoate decarboxylase [Metapseudomonas furukawaii]|jgi:acetolactate synthase-1/2/3 large subunit|uniref:Acetohydroxy acid synthase n=1 Tax=Metapseudomonas furukawaii TaxID=1149133 RepID=A0AAD1C0N7_METFU|nr:5-guanidino-2-oxopentanoate decarboxylase [Pseudomonas furukawaii]ELS25253.1 Acetohydroxy acid synthase [Pseudomonas furukawaii]BAU74612.1 acetohydroxy acid synthase [Pseudomonas furukawaii]
MLTCGELLVELLEGFGVDTVFGIPGVHTVELYRGLPNTRIRHITPRHEQGAGFMADGYARVSGKPGVCFIITGPGMTNITTAMGQAYADSIPMLVISAVNNTEQLGMGGGRLHELPSQRNLVSGVAAFSHTLMRPDELPEVLSRAFAVFNGARPRPVHIEIPIDVITAPADHVRRKLGAQPSRPGPAAEAIARAAELLKGARRPLVLLGGGCADAGAEARRLVEALDAPTAYTINAKGVLPKGHPLALGCNQAWVPVRQLVLESDVILAVGTELGETDYDVVFDGNFRIESTLIRVDIDAEQLNRNYPADLAILSDARLALAALADALAPGATFSADSAGSRRAAAVREALDAQWPATWNGQRKVLDLLQATLPDLIVAGDSTQPVYSGNHLFEATRPRSWFNSATGYGTLGYGLPAAIGAKLAAPERPVIALIGDGGIQFTLPELASAVEAGAPIIVLLWNNSGYGEIKRYMQNRDIPTIGVDIYTPDFQGLARAFGCNAAKAESLEHLAELLAAAAKADRPTVIEVWEHAGFLA